MVLTLALLGALVGGIGVLRNPNTLPFHRVKIVAHDSHLEVQQLRHTVLTHLDGGFFSLDVRRLRRAVLALPWVGAVSLRRMWPDQLIVMVTAQQPIARWQQGWLINRHGQLFKPALVSIPKGLPQLKGPDKSLPRVLRRFHDFQRALFPFGAVITQLVLDPSQGWSVVVNGHTTIALGHRDIERRFDRFMTSYPRVIGKNINKIDHVDLRYPHGFAIGWKKVKVTTKVSEIKY